MATFNFNPTSPAISVHFRCSKCSNIEASDYLNIPTPDWTAETHHDSVSSDEYEHICSKCGTSYLIELHNGIYGGYGEIRNIEEDNIVNIDEYMEYDPEWEYLFVEEHVKDIVKVLDSLDPLDENTKKILYQNLYANLIAIMEAYLCESIKAEVMKSDENKRSFIEHYKPFKDEKISLSEIMTKFEQIDTLIINALNGLIYHNLGKIKPIYRDVLNVDLGDISSIMKVVKIRHDIVHRNGKTIDGNEHIIDKNDVQELATLIGEFISNIENQINPTTICDVDINLTESTFEDLLK